MSAARAIYKKGPGQVLVGTEALHLKVSINPLNVASNLRQEFVLPIRYELSVPEWVVEGQGSQNLLQECRTRLEVVRRS